MLHFGNCKSSILVFLVFKNIKMWWVKISRSHSSWFTSISSFANGPSKLHFLANVFIQTTSSALVPMGQPSIVLPCFLLEAAGSRWGPRQSEPQGVEWRSSKAPILGVLRKSQVFSQHSKVPDVTQRQTRFFGWTLILPSMPLNNSRNQKANICE